MPSLQLLYAICANPKERLLFIPCKRRETAETDGWAGCMLACAEAKRWRLGLSCPSRLPWAAPAFFWSNETAYDIWRLVIFSHAVHGKCAPKPLLGSDDKGWEGSLC
jgi:hypothetical protein